MAISLRTPGTWVAANATTQTVTLPTHATGDMLLVRVAFKHATMPTTVTCDTAGWAKVGQYNNGTTVSGNGTGSVIAAVFWKVAESASETDPVITYHASVAATPSAAVAMAYQKAANEAWSTPVGDGGSVGTSTALSATIQSHVSATAGDLIDFFHSQGDNNTLTVPTFTQAGLTLGTVAEQPDAALSSATSNDIDADGGYRAVSSGTSSAAAVVTGTSTAGDQGSAWTTRLRVQTVSTFEGSFTADSSIKATISGAFTADSNIKATVASGFTADANVKQTLSSGLTADAYVRTVFASNLTADAHVGKTTSGSFTTDASIEAAGSTVSGDLTADADIDANYGPWSETFSNTVSAATTIPGSFGADANIKATLAGSLTADAFVKNTLAGSLTADAYVLKIQSESFSANAQIKATISSSLTADAQVAVVVPGAGSFTADAFIRKLGLNGSFSADADIQRTLASSLTADAYVKATQLGSFAADASIKATLDRSVTADAFIRVTFVGGLTADADVKCLGLAGSFTGDAYVLTSQIGSIELNAYIVLTAPVEALVLVNDESSLFVSDELDTTLSVDDESSVEADDQPSVHVIVNDALVE